MMRITEQLFPMEPATMFGGASASRRHVPRLPRRVRGLVAPAFCAGLLLIGLAPQASRAATINAVSCSQGDVDAAVNSASDGDTVLIPAGTCVWTSQLTALSSPKGVMIQGAGIDQTIIIDNVNKAGGGAQTILFPVNTAAGKRFRLTGLTFKGQAQDTQIFNKGTLLIYGTAQDVRIDHVKFDQTGTAAIRIYGFVLGVIDHCNFNLPNGQQAIVVYHDQWNGVPWGDGSFADQLYFGTNKAMYIEDNVFIGTGIAGKGAVDAVGGGRFVFRYNQVKNENVATHGTESGGRYRGVRSYEVYNNVFTTSTEMFTAILLRGGTGVIFNNTSTGYTNLVLASVYRTLANYPPWGKCDGSSAYDANSLTNGYPCIDQFGWGSGSLISNDDPPTPVAWPQQVLAPVYIWNNTYTPTVSVNATEVASQQPGWIAAGREFIKGTAKPGYSPYVYPHPLVMGAGSSDMTAPAAPVILSIK